MRRTLFGIVVVCTLLLTATAGSAGTTGTLVYGDFFGQGGLFTIQPDGSGRAHLAGTDGAVLSRWAPDGSGIAFFGKRGSIVWCDPTGADRRVLFSRRAFPEDLRSLWGLSWSPDGTQLLVSLVGRSSSKERLFLGDIATGDLSPLVRNARSADWSSSGRIVAIRGGRLITMDADGSNVSVLVGSDGNENPRWSPDASRIAFQRSANDGYDIFVIDADGSNRANLTRSPQMDWAPAWSPDGSMIAWTRSATFDTYSDLFLMQDDGSGVTRVTHTANVDEFFPDWTAA